MEKFTNSLASSTCNADKTETKVENRTSLPCVCTTPQDLTEPPIQGNLTMAMMAEISNLSKDAKMKSAHLEADAGSASEYITVGSKEQQNEGKAQRGATSESPSIIRMKSSPTSRRDKHLITPPENTSTTTDDKDLNSNDELNEFEDTSIEMEMEEYSNFEYDLLINIPTKAKKAKSVVIDSEPKKDFSDKEGPSLSNWFSFLWGGGPSQSHLKTEKLGEEAKANSSPQINSIPQVALVQHDLSNDLGVASSVNTPEETVDGYVEAVNDQEFYIDSRMPQWIDKQFYGRDKHLLKGATYQLGESRTIIVHELIRGAWTWCTAWSPDGRYLAIGTENHQLAVVDTFISSVWRVKHDRRERNPTRKADVTHSIRCIAWGENFIATGGVGGSVSIIETKEPYSILHQIKTTGFVGSLDWLLDTNTLVIGSRDGKATIVKIWTEHESNAFALDMNQQILTATLYTIDRGMAWVNTVKFSPGGRAVAVGDSKGILGVYGYEETSESAASITNIANFKLEDSILDVEWSPDGHWLYVGGEDFCVTVISTPTWEAVHRIKRGRWVQFISSSNGGSHVAIGGVSAEVSIMDVDCGWEAALNVGLKGIVPLSAKWHPQDQYLVVTGQNNSILALETTGSRYVPGHYLSSASPILCIDFSPDGRMVAIGNEGGVVTIFELSGTSFTTIYELVLDGDGSLSLEWSKDGSFLSVVAGSKVVIVSKSKEKNALALPNTSGFKVAKVIRDFALMHDVAISPNARYVAISGFKKTKFLDAKGNFQCIFEIEKEGTSISNAWSPDGCWFATIGKNQHLLIYDTASTNPAKWQVIFTVQIQQPGLAVAWGPSMDNGLQYCAYGGDGQKIYVMEIRTRERSWETVLAIPREGIIHDLDWNDNGLVAAAVDDGTVTVIDLAYLQSGFAVNEMDYNWQRQALACFTEIRRNKGKNSMKSARWIPSTNASDSFLACGGTDGEVEIIDLTNRRRCQG